MKNFITRCMVFMWLSQTNDQDDPVLEVVGSLLRDKLGMKRELVITRTERRGEDERPGSGSQLLAVSFLHKEDKLELLERRADLEAEGVRVTEDMAPGQLGGWGRLSKLQAQVMEKHPNIQVWQGVKPPLHPLSHPQTVLSPDRLIVEDRVVTCDPQSGSVEILISLTAQFYLTRKLLASSLIFLPRKSKSK